MPSSSSQFARVYSDEQRAALELAWGDRGIRPASRIASMAAAGELRGDDGEQLAPFRVPAQSVRDIGRKYLRRRAGLERSELTAREPRDAVEQLRRRLICAVDAELEQLEREQRSKRRRGDAGERIRQLARAAREIAALPAPGETAPAPSPRKRPDEPGGLAGRILRASSGAPPALEQLEPEPAARAAPAPYIRP